MNLSIKRRAILLALCTTSLLSIQTTWAASPVPGYPDKAIRLIVPFPAGGTTDVVARLLAQSITAQWGQSVVVDNRGGASGMIGASEGALAAPDGYTITVGNNQTHSTNATLFSKPSFDIVNGVAPIAMLTRTKHVLVVPAASPIQSLQQLVATGKTKALNYGTSSVGASSHILSNMLARKTGMKDATAIPYKGAAPLMVDLLGGQIDFTTATYGSAASYIRENKLRVLAITGEQRDPELPNVPTFSELGLPSLTLESWIGLYAPARTPEPILQAWSDAASKALAAPKVVQTLKSAGFEVWFKPMAEMKTFHPEEIKRWGDAIKEGGITLD